ncbi:hypothetical protein M4951_23880 [Blastopirellula sp. J2-11]|uniref:hypothetical protein n=1 Tax=Blastopirellula sp. J2-11 TaxID=2943192 RepID=UPI0021C6B609|nr:hypothetical protein [Blastopirellula sp. J2-11]UUO06373.1 hypothetical protein M4951_23880 [Blastopirellula sp. J2-11]
MEDSPWEKSEAVSQPSDVPRSRYQFSLWQILVLTLLVSVIAAWARLIREQLIWFYVLYFSALAAYAVLRIPRVTSQLLRARRAAAKNKSDVIAFAEDARRRKRADEQDREQESSGA